MSRQRTVGVVAMVAGFMAVAMATLTPVRGTVEASNVWCISCSSLAVADALMNIVLFVPLGFGIGLLAGRVSPAVAALALMSIAIEAVQAGVLPGRDSSLRDVVANTLGGVIGIILARHWRSWLLPRAAIAGRLAIAAAVVWVGTLGATAALTHPSIPPGDYWGQRGGTDGGVGTVVSVAVNDMPVPLGPLANPRAVLLALNSENVGVKVAVTPVTRSAATGPIARLSNPRTEAFQLAQRGHDFTFSLRLRSADARLRSPVVRLRGPIAGGREEPASSASPPDTLHLQAGVRDGVLHLARDGPPSSGAELSLSPTVGWAFFVPLGIVTRIPSWVLSALWVAAMCFPLGYWTGAAGNDRQRPSAGDAWRPSPWRLPLGIAATVVGALVLLPVGAGTPWPPWPDWCVALIAMLCGAAAARALRRATESADIR